MHNIYIPNIFSQIALVQLSIKHNKARVIICEFDTFDSNCFSDVNIYLDLTFLIIATNRIDFLFLSEPTVPIN